MSYNLQRSTHFNQQQSELAAIQRDIAHGAYGFRNTFDEWETRQARAADQEHPHESYCPECGGVSEHRWECPNRPVESEEGGEDEIEMLRRTR